MIKEQITKKLQVNLQQPISLVRVEKSYGIPKKTQEAKGNSNLKGTLSMRLHDKK